MGKQIQLIQKGKIRHPFEGKKLGKLATKPKQKAQTLCAAFSFQCPLAFAKQFLVLTTPGKKAFESSERGSENAGNQNFLLFQHCLSQL